ncbi:MAG TPA: hypothetical protein VMV51_08135, partial [Gemmatimonadaceae bacterium]|nr:hypothetical protein [Gemmatimonadaceae bacterium]
HTGSTILADLNRTIDPESVWGRFQWGKTGIIRWYRRVYERLRDAGFTAPIMAELVQVVEALERQEQPHMSSTRI